MNIEERVEFYLGDCLSKTPDREIIQNTVLHLDTNKYHIHNKNIFSLERAQKLHIDPLRNLINKYGIVNKNIHTMPGDVNCKSLDFYALSKTRLVNEPKHNFVLVKCFDQLRHWEHCYELDNIRFEEKVDKAIWRGTLTGHNTPIRQNNRITLIENYYSSHYADVGLTGIAKEQGATIAEKYAPLVEDRVKIEFLRNYKYIISIEGNDKDSGLNWKLMSNSVVLMAKPIYNSWLMEEKLIPNFHYVELKDDLSDLEEKIHWCNKNPNECKNIIYNAHEYMKQFFIQWREEIIELKVITSFIESTNV